MAKTNFFYVCCMPKLIKSRFYIKLAKKNNMVCLYLISSIITHPWSTFAVASSITSILLFLTMARAKQISWRCPTLKLEPPSVTSWLRSLTTFFNSTWIKKTYNYFGYSPEIISKRCKIFEIILFSKAFQLPRFVLPVLTDVPSTSS